MEHSIGQILNMNGVILWQNLLSAFNTSEAFDSHVAIVNRITDSSHADNYAWRNDKIGGLTKLEKIAFHANEASGKQYWNEKWGFFQCDLSGRKPSFDIPTKPFLK
jgi:hypothetical protein